VSNVRFIPGTCGTRSRVQNVKCQSFKKWYLEIFVIRRRQWDLHT